MHRWTLFVTLVFVAPACKDIDPAGPVTGVSLDTPAGGSDGSGASTQPDDGTIGVTEAPDSASSTGPAVTSAETSGASSPTSASTPSDPTADPTNGPDPTETAFILPMTDEGGDPGGDPSSNPSSDPSGDPSGGDPTFGQCGWSSQANYYDCSSNGAAPGVSDPSATYPIDCPDGLQEGAPCDEQNGPIGNVGCCDPGGTLYYCTTQGNSIVKEECGA